MQGYLAAHSLATIRKGKSAADARATLTNLLQFIRVAPVDQAINLDYRDCEDAVQMICALQIKADHLVTRNIRDYQPALLSVLQPIDFLATM